MSVLKTRVLCKPDGRFHTVTWLKDGTVHCNRCSDVQERADRIATMLRLGGGGNAEPSSCAALVALVQHGCEIILKRQANEDGYQDLDGWREIYVRFETNSAVVRQMKAVRKRLRAEMRSREKRESIDFGGGEPPPRPVMKEST